jgi:DNA repair protein RAD16
MSQWHREIQAFSTPRTLAVSVYYGPDRPADPHILRSQHVVISTYGTLQSDYTAATRAAARVDADGSISGARSGLYGLRWGRVVLDEAHHIKVRFQMEGALGLLDLMCVHKRTRFPTFF